MSKNKVKRKLRFNPLRSFLTVIVFIITGYLIFSIAKEVLLTVSLTNELQALNEQLKIISDETRDLEERKEKLEDPNYIKSFARGEYSITKEGEQVFRLPSQSDDSSDD